MFSKLELGTTEHLCWLHLLDSVSIWIKHSIWKLIHDLFDVFFHTVWQKIQERKSYCSICFLRRHTQSFLAWQQIKQQNNLLMWFKANSIYRGICREEDQTFLAGSLESAYSSIWGSHEVWGQDLGTFMISSPIYHGSDWWKFSIWNSVTSFYNITRQQCGRNIHNVNFLFVKLHRSINWIETFGTMQHFSNRWWYIFGGS